MSLEIDDSNDFCENRFQLQVAVCLYIKQEWSSTTSPWCPSTQSSEFEQWLARAATHEREATPTTNWLRRMTVITLLLENKLILEQLHSYVFICMPFLFIYFTFYLE